MVVRGIKDYIEEYLAETRRTKPIEKRWQAINEAKAKERRGGAMENEAMDHSAIEETNL